MMDQSYFSQNTEDMILTVSYETYEKEYKIREKEIR